MVSKHWLVYSLIVDPMCEICESSGLGNHFWDPKKDFLNGLRPYIHTFLCTLVRRGPCGLWSIDLGGMNVQAPTSAWGTVV